MLTAKLPFLYGQMPMGLSRPIGIAGSPSVIVRHSHYSGTRAGIANGISRANNDSVCSTILVVAVSRCYQRDSERITYLWSETEAATRLDFSILILYRESRATSGNGLASRGNRS